MKRAAATMWCSKAATVKLCASVRGQFSLRWQLRCGRKGGNHYERYLNTESGCTMAAATREAAAAKCGASFRWAWSARLSITPTPCCSVNSLDFKAIDAELRGRLSSRR
ncbi:hypothetical protein NDU88_002171 [Pleurodeles waltl]|uniref:Uncharacterized protein n=1 Tax=Pleurodeles waltl TaxID=8319 RepID=A0AAV7TLU0_PLEWA|nr:hypothetical protein NDU88_002171 [Pleurodeles waltl]